MCIMVYVALDYPLPTVAWDEARPRFHFTELSDRDEPVRRQFSKPWVYYVGSHEGCGCGFQYGEFEEFEGDDATWAAAQDSRRRLAEFLAVALQHQVAVELFACWDGDQAAEPEHRGRVRPANLMHDRTFFREKELLVVSEVSDEPGPTAAQPRD
jgi:hypothetical protein